jgi:ankyrin repeat protein
MRSYFKYVLYLIVLIQFSISHAGSYEDYFLAIDKDNSVLISALLQRGFDPNTVNPRGQHGLLIALRESSLKVVDVLLAHPGTDIEARTPQDESPLMLAALNGLKDVCIKLIERDADVNKTGWSPLHYAATGGHLEIIRLLLDHHAYIDAASPNGSTPLMMAAMYGTPAVVKVLLDAGADVAIKNSLGLTALDFALNAKRSESADLLATYIRARNSKGAW